MAAFPNFKAYSLVAVADSNYVMVCGKGFHAAAVDTFNYNNAGNIIERHSIQANNEIAWQVAVKMPTP